MKPKNKKILKDKPRNTDTVLVIGKAIQIVLVRELGKNKAGLVMKSIAKEIDTLLT